MENRKININTASEEDIRAVCDVAPGTAETIVKERAKKPFSSLEELDRVYGIGGTIVDRMKQNGCYAE